MALVTIGELIDYMDISFTNKQEDGAQLVLTGLQSELEGWLRRPVEPQPFTESYIVDENHFGLPDNIFYNPAFDTADYGISFAAVPTYIQYVDNSPINSVTSVTRQGRLDAAPTALTEGSQYVVRPYGVYLFTAYPDDKITITYNAGLDGSTIGIFKLLILRAASREVQNLHDDVVGLKDLNTRNVAPIQTGFTEQELLSVKRWKRHRV